MVAAGIALAGERRGRALQDARRRHDDHLLIGGPGEVKLCPGVFLVQLRQYLGEPAEVVVRIGAELDWPRLVHAARRQHAMRRVIVVQRQRQLAQVVAALHPPRGFPRLLHRRQQERDQQRDHSHHHQQFDQCKTATLSLHVKYEL